MNENPNTWMGVAFGALALAGTIVTGVFTYLNSQVNRSRERDKMEFDSQLVALKSEQAQWKAHNERCEEAHKVVLKKLDECEEKHELTESRLSTLESRIPRTKPGGGDSAIHRK